MTFVSLSFAFLFLFLSCSNTPSHSRFVKNSKKTQKRKRYDQRSIRERELSFIKKRISSNILRKSDQDIGNFFLPEIPEKWNFRSPAKCFVKNRPKYLDFKKVKNFFGLNYQQMIDLQMYINEDEKADLGQLADEVKSGKGHFFSKSILKAQVIWVDPYIQEEEKLFLIINEFLKEKTFSSTFIFVSMCFDVKVLQKKLKRLEQDHFFILLPNTAFSLFDSEAKRRPFFGLQIKKLFPDSEVSIYQKNYDFLN